MTQTTSDAIAHYGDRQIFIPDDDDVKFVMALEAKLEADAEDPIEVDSLGDGTYRVWAGMTFIGIVFERSKIWIAKPTSDCQERFLSSSEQAIQAVVDTWRYGA